MLTRLEIQGYRGFESYKMEGLSRVNLFVGKNNSGKTSLLEGIALLAGGSAWGIVEIATRRGEILPNSESRIGFPEITNFFYGRELKDGIIFSISANNGYIPITMRLSDEGDQTETFVRTTDDFIDATKESFLEGLNGFRNPYHLYVDSPNPSSSGRASVLITDEGAFDPRSVERIRGSLFRKQYRETIFIPPDSLTYDALSELWDEVIIGGQEDNIVSALKVIEQALTKISFLSSQGRSTYREQYSPRGIVARLEGISRPVPLGSMGDGMRRLLALSVSLNRAQNGILLIDEIDTGLHYSVMIDLWKLIVENARRLNIQVFATTHSWDCIEGLGEYCEQYPEMASEVAVHKIVQPFHESIPFSGDRLPNIIENRIEIR